WRTCLGGQDCCCGARDSVTGIGCSLGDTRVTEAERVPRVKGPPAKAGGLVRINRRGCPDEPRLDQAQVRSSWTGQRGTYVDRRFPDERPIASSDRTSSIPGCRQAQGRVRNGPGSNAACQPCRGERVG